MTDEVAKNLEKALQEHAGECWRVRLEREDDGVVMLRVTPHYFGAVQLSALANATPGEPGAFVQRATEALDGVRYQMVDGLRESIR